MQRTLVQPLEPIGEQEAMDRRVVEHVVLDSSSIWEQVEINVKVFRGQVLY